MNKCGLYAGSVLIFALFVGCLLLGFFVYTKVTEKKIRKELETKTQEVVREIYSNCGKFTRELCERVLTDYGYKLKEAKCVVSMIEERQKLFPDADFIYKGERFH